MNSYEIGTAVGNVVEWIVIAMMIGGAVWLVGAFIYFTYLTVKEAPSRRASKAMNAKVDAIKAANRARNRAECARIYGGK